MKISKLIFLFMLAVATVGCNKDDDNGPEPYVLSNANLAGSYKTTLLKGHIEQTFNVNGSDVQSITDIVGDTFQLTTVFAVDGTYTTSGQYRTVTTVTTANNPPEITTEIILVDDSGTYVLNTTTKKITITVDGDSDTFDVALFNETKLNLFQESSDPIGGVPTTATFNINFERK